MIIFERIGMLARVHSSWITLDKNAKVSFVAVSRDLRENNTMSRGCFVLLQRWMTLNVYCKNYCISTYEMPFIGICMTNVRKYKD